MITIPIRGVISQDYEYDTESNVTPASLAKSIKEAGNEDLLITINTPGGSVFAGLEMFSMIQNHPANVEVRVIALAASMGSILVLAGNKKTIEKTAMYFMHNAQGVGIGDYREMAKASKWLEDVSQLLAEIYTENTTLSIEKARELMDADTQFYGKDLEDLGFEIVESTTGQSQALTKVNAQTRLKEVAAKFSQEEILSDLEKTAASIAGKKKKPQTTAKKTAAVTTGKNNKEKNEMDEIKNLSDLENKFPDLFAQAVQKGIEQEQDRAEAHLTLGEEAGCLELAVENIRNKAEFSSAVSAKYMAEGMKNKDIKNSTDDNPDDTGDGEATDEEDTKAFTAKFVKRMGGAK